MRPNCPVSTCSTGTNCLISREEADPRTFDTNVLVFESPEHYLEILKTANCDRIYSDNSPRFRHDRPELKRHLREILGGDTLILLRLFQRETSL